MNPQIDFYLLNAEDNAARLLQACRLIDQAYQSKRKVYIHVADEAMAHALDERLWTFEDNSFVSVCAHCI